MISPLFARRTALGASLLAGVVALLPIACRAPEPHEAFPESSNILLITIDTLRADHLSTYGYVRRTTPVIDRLASEGVRFDRAAVQWPKTGPSFTSIFTATYPKDNKIVRKIGIPLPLDYEMLAEVLSAQGYSTAAVVANGAVGAEFNFDQGFDRYVQTWKVEGVEGPPNVAARVTDEALALAADLPTDRPYFLWVHYLDPHFPYTPPEGWAGKFVDDEFSDPSEKIPVDRTKRRRQMAAIGRDQMLDDREDLAFYIARYDEEIAYTDAEVGRLLDTMGGNGQLESTLTVLTSDHGESLGDHKYFFDHGRFSFQTCLRVPFILHYPGVLEPAVDPQPVELIDLTPTILDIARVPTEDGTWKQGQSLLPRLLGLEETVDDRLAFSEAGYALNGNWQKVVQDSRYKLILVRAGQSQRWIGGRGQQWVMYDLEHDPGETENVVQSAERDARRLQKELLAWLNTEPFPVGVGGEISTEEGEMDDETREQLKALGYIQ